MASQLVCHSSLREQLRGVPPLPPFETVETAVATAAAAAATAGDVPIELGSSTG